MFIKKYSIFIVMSVCMFRCMVLLVVSSLIYYYYIPKKIEEKNKNKCEKYVCIKNDIDCENIGLPLEMMYASDDDEDEDIECEIKYLDFGIMKKNLSNIKLNEFKTYR